MIGKTKLKPNIIFLVIDSFRADLCGTKVVSSPQIDSLIEQGIFLDHTITSSDYTIPCIQSIFTGQFPIGCGKTKEEYHKLLSHQNNYLSLLKEEGYSLFATIGKLLYSLGLGEHFDNKDMVFEESQNLHNGLGDKIIEKLEEITTKEPWFYYIHLLDLHRPCEVPSSLKHLKHSERYAYNIETIDKWIGTFLQKIDLEKTLVIITADHGDYVSEETEDGISGGLKQVTKSAIKKLIPSSLKPLIHEKKQNLLRKIKASQLSSSHEKRALNTRPMRDRLLFDDFVRVPLIISGYSIKHKPTISQQVCSIDIMPTIFEIIKSTKSTKSEGKSFAPIFKGHTIEKRDAYMENAILWTESQSPEPSIGIRTDDYKYFHSLNNSEKNIHLYELKNDPFEDNNIAANNPKLIKQFEETLTRIIENSTERIETDKLDEESEKKVEQELKKLGYV